MDGIDWKGVPLYQITNKTLALRCDKVAYYGTRIFDIEHTSELYVKESIQDLLVANCMDQGSSFVGRRDFSKAILKSNRNLPIAIQPKKGLFFFPTSSIQKPEGMELNYFQVETYRRKDTLTKVIFSNNQVHYIDISYNKFDAQMSRTSRVIAGYYRTYL